MSKKKKPRNKKYNPNKRPVLANESIGENHIVDLMMKTNPAKLTDNDRVLLTLPMKLALDDLKDQKANPEAHLTFAERAHWLWCIYEHFKKHYNFSENFTEEQEVMYRLDWSLSQEYILNDVVKVLENLRARSKRNAYGIYVTVDEIPVLQWVIDKWHEVIDQIDAGVIYSACILHRHLLLKDADKSTQWDPFRVHYQTVNPDGKGKVYHYTSRDSERIVNHITSHSVSP